ncbi:MAG TPA: stage III sporulation protein AF [Bacillales bacterium]|nr:stage III sporulation protein AF [Bacillales bacterium]
MDYITSWIKEIILLIMLAVVLELLLPNSTLQRYVRMVVGLLLLLALLKPVLSVFDTNVNEMFTKFSSSPVVQDEQINNSLKNKKKEIQAAQLAYIEHRMDVQARKKIKKEVSSRYHLEVAKVDFDLKGVKFGQSPANVQHVTVTLTKHVPKEDGKVKIEPVQPVTVDVNKPAEQSSSKNPRQKKIRTYLANRWQLPEKKITVVLEGGEEGES